MNCILRFRLLYLIRFVLLMISVSEDSEYSLRFWNHVYGGLVILFFFFFIFAILGCICFFVLLMISGSLINILVGLYLLLRTIHFIALLYSKLLIDYDGLD